LEKNFKQKIFEPELTKII